MSYQDEYGFYIMQTGMRFRNPLGVRQRPAHIGDLSPMKYYDKNNNIYPITNILQLFDLYMDEEGTISAQRSHDKMLIAKRKTMKGINNALKKYAEKWQKSIDKKELTKPKGE